MQKFIISLALLCALPFSAQANKWFSGNTHLVGELGLEFGGDDVATVVFTDGSRQAVEAGQWLSIAIIGG